MGWFVRATVTYIDSTSELDDPATAQFDERVQQGPAAAKTVTEGDGSELNSNRLYKLVATSAQAVDTTEEPEAGGQGPVPPPDFSVSSLTREVAENARVGHYVGAPVTAMGAISYSLSSGSQDHTFFDIDGNGQNQGKGR